MQNDLKINSELYSLCKFNFLSSTIFRLVGIPNRYCDYTVAYTA